MSAYEFNFFKARIDHTHGDSKPQHPDRRWQYFLIEIMLYLINILDIHTKDCCEVYDIMFFGYHIHSIT